MADNTKDDKEDVDCNGIRTTIHVIANDVKYKDYEKVIDKVNRKITEIPGVFGISINRRETDSISGDILSKENMKDPKKRKKIKLVKKLVQKALDGSEDVSEYSRKQIIKNNDDLGAFIKNHTKDEDEAFRYRLKIHSPKRQNLGAVFDVFIDKCDTLRFVIGGGINGGSESNNKWGEYFSSLRDFLTILNSNPEVNSVWLIAIDNDWGDDVFYAEFGIDLKDGGDKDE